MKEPFEEIRIVDLDVDLTQPSDEAPGFRRLYLKLSEEPPSEWVRIFEQERRFPAHPVWRNAWIVGAHIVVECIPEDLEQFQLNHLREDVANANRKFSEWTASNVADTLRQLSERAEARRNLENLRTRLRFDRELSYQEITIRPKVNTMGDKSPKAMNKHATQKQAKANSDRQRKQQAITAKQVAGKKQ